MQQNNMRLALRISLKSILVNVFLFAFKLVCGIIIGSSSLVSDAIHSLSDVMSTAVVMLGVKISGNPSDDSHPYGHEKVEVVIAFVLALLLFYIGATIAYDGIKKIILPQTDRPVNVLLNIIGMVSAIASIVLKEWLYRITKKCAERMNSKAMTADAWHHRTDSLSSVGSLIGVIGMTFEIPVVDSVACLVISLFIFKAAVDIMSDSFNCLVDHSCSKKTIMQIEKLIYSQQGVVSLDILKTRMFSSKIYVDLEITVDGDLTVRQAHKIASNLHDRIEDSISNIKHCMVHVNPTGLTMHHHI